MDDMKRYIDAFEAYITELMDAVENKIPRILEEAVEIGEKFSRVQNEA